MSNITVIIPTHNRENVLGRALDSVLRQSKQPKQIIVVDDGSTDNTQEFLRLKYPSITYIKQNQKGVSAARNSGIRAANYDWIAFLDSDDVWMPRKLEACVAAPGAEAAPAGMRDCMSAIRSVVSGWLRK